MTDKIISLLPNEYGTSLKQFEESGRLSVFLDALSTLGGTPFKDDRLFSAWQKKCSEVESQAPMNEFLTWLAGHEFGIDMESTQLDEELNGNQRKAINESVNAFIAYEDSRSRYIQELASELNGMYVGVNSAYQFRDVLREVFGDDDPAKIVSRYKRALLPIGSHNRPSRRLISNRTVQAFIRDDLANWVIKKERALCDQQKGSDDIVISLRAECLSDQLDSIEPEWDRLLTVITHGPKTAVLIVPLTNLRGLVELLPQLPQAAFEQTFLFLRTALDDYKLLDRDGHGFGIFVDLVTSLPLLQPLPTHIDPATLRFPEGSCLSRLDIAFYPGQVLPFVPLPLLTGAFWLVENHRGYLRSDMEGAYSPDQGAFTTVVLRERIRAAMEALCRMKQKSASVFSSIPEQDWYDFGFVLNQIAEFLSIEPDFLIEMCLSTDEDRYALDASLDLIDGFTSHNRRDVWSLRTYRAATADGLHELANARLAYGIVIQSLRAKGRFVADWSKIGEMIASAQRYPGYSYVQKAIAYAHGAYLKSAGDTNPTTDYLVLSGWAAQSPGDAIPQDRILDLDRRLLERELKQDVGEKNWFKIRSATVIQLVDAKSQWAIMYRLVGRGHQDFGSVANAFVKAIEGELGFYLKPVIASETYQTWKQTIEKNVTLGPMLHLLKKYSSLPSDLRMLIDETGIKIQNNPDLIQKLFTALRLRNEGSHPTPFRVKELADLLALLFEKRLLREFFDLLPPICETDG